MQKYEIAVLYHPDLEIDLEKATSKVDKIFTNCKGKVIEVDNWGKRKLAYPIKKQEHAIYVFYTVELTAENVHKVETIFNITNEIIRFLITKVDLKAIAKAEDAKARKAKRASRLGDSDEDNDQKDKDSEE